MSLTRQRQSRAFDTVVCGESNIGAHFQFVAVCACALIVSACSPSTPPKNSTVAEGTNAIQGEAIKPLVSSRVGTPNTPDATLSNSQSKLNLETQTAATKSAPIQDRNGPNVQPSSTSLSSADTNQSPNKTSGASNEALADFSMVGFDKLAAYNFEVTDDILNAGTNVVAASTKTAEQIPSTVKAFDQKRVAVKGFMLPLKVEGGKVTELLLMRDQSMCCYGAVPKINEWVSVKMVGGGVRPIMDQAITMFGTLHVGEMRENGYLVGIYRMDGEKMAGPIE